MPALVNSRLGESGIRLAEGTMVWPFDLKKSRNDCRISKLVILIRRMRIRKAVTQDQKGNPKAGMDRCSGRGSDRSGVVAAASEARGDAFGTRASPAPSLSVAGRADESSEAG